ncbi:AAA family ATPase [Fusobacterium varium]|nr:AAA family ATPase [Fusobacterium varium]
MFKKPMLTDNYIKHGNYILGPLKTKEENGECCFISEASNKQQLRRYQYKKIAGNIAKVTYVDNLYGETDFEFLYNNEELLNYELVDYITPEQLLEIYFKGIKENEYLTQKEIDNVYKKLKSKTLFSVNKAEREKIIKEIFTANSAYNSLKKELIDIILKSEKDREELFEELQKKYPAKFNTNQVEEITTSKKKIIKSKVVSEEKLLEDKENLTKEIKKLTKDKEVLVKEVNEYNKDKENLEKEIKNSNKTLKEITQEYRDLEDNIEKLVTTKQEKESEIEKLNEEVQKLKNSNKNKILELHELETEKKDLEKQLSKYEDKNKAEYKELLNNSIEKLKEAYSRKKFDDFTLKAIDEIMGTNEKEKNKINEKETTNYPIIEKEINEKDFIEFLYEFINSTAKRKISRNEVINIILCLSQGFLTIFAGEPGTGKTSLCNILGKALGLFKQENSRYLEVSIEKGWTSKRDFIGYYNPLSQKFDSMNKIVFDGFELLDKEKKNKNEIYPFIITLDEANLSPMEYYWADFMNNCDLENEYRNINMGENYIYNLPKNLRFLATINYDHTTEVLSPRLIDRAWIILLEISSIDINNLININIPAEETMIKYEILEKFINIDNLELDKTSIGILNKVISCMREAGISISPRVLKMIKNYCVIGNKYFDISENKYIALDYAISQKLLPLLEGYGSEYEKFLNKLKNTIGEELPKAKYLLENIIIKGNNNMKHFNFFCK